MGATADQLHRDARVTAARQLLKESQDADGKQVDAARWWGRLETGLAGVLAAIEEVPPF
ncbi:hypothetical protein ACFYY8_33790 [Streptosporangium sp. NPDC001559]|uniref:hypothetical protein n=1 Tax=Streptosporangium sp. NPDC001559 TaxID=3366187 RepID=UPI0036E3653B